jgi:hypothetical protein
MAEANPAAVAPYTTLSASSAPIRLWLFALSILLSVPRVAMAQSVDAALGTATSGLRGLIYTGLPVAPREFNLNVSGGYGLIEAIAPVRGAHHHVQGSLGVAIVPLSWLSLALRLDGRLEMHPDDYDGSHSGGFGDPRLFARAGHQLTPELALGAELGVWFPGNNAPSFVPSATTIDARGLVSFTPQHSPWVLLGALGFRLDNSANSAPDLTRLRLGDRITLGLSSSNAVLVALGIARRIDKLGEVFAEVSADMLVGSAAPPLAQSPLRAALGGRYFPSSVWQAELSVSAALSQRPDVGASDPLVPIEPRFLVLAAVRYSLPLDRPSSAVVRPGIEARPQSVAPSLAQQVQTASVAGTLVDEKGEPLPEVTLKLQAAQGEPRETITDAQGRYVFAEVPVGPATLQATANGFKTQTWQVDVQTGLAPQSPRALISESEHGVLRGLVRSFRSAPLRAQIVVRNARGKNVANRESGADGVFEIELPPGNYRVTISAPGFAPHSRSMQIGGNAVSILNVDMREK